VQLLHALDRKKTMFENVNVDWRLGVDEGSTDFSDDEGLLDAPDVSRTPNGHSPAEALATTPRSRARPMSAVAAAAASASRSGRFRRENSEAMSRSVTEERSPPHVMFGMPPPPPPQGKKPGLCE